MEINNYTYTILTENKPGVLYRIADVFLRRKVNIENLLVAETTKPGISKFTIIVKQDQNSVRKTINQLNKIVEIIEVTANTKTLVGKIKKN